MYISLETTLVIMSLCAFALGSMCMWAFYHRKELTYDAYYDDEAEQVIIPEEEEP